MIERSAFLNVDLQDPTKQIILWPPKPDFIEILINNESVRSQVTSDTLHNFSGVFTSTGNIFYCKTGNQVTCTLQDDVISAFVSGAKLISDAIPSNFRPSKNVICVVNVKNNNLFLTGTVQFITDHWEFSGPNLGNFTAASCGVQVGVSWSYTL